MEQRPLRPCPRSHCESLQLARRRTHCRFAQCSDFLLGRFRFRRRRDGAPALASHSLRRDSRVWLFLQHGLLQLLSFHWFGLLCARSCLARRGRELAHRCRHLAACLPSASDRIFMARLDSSLRLTLAAPPKILAPDPAHSCGGGLCRAKSISHAERKFRSRLAARPLLLDERL